MATISVEIGRKGKKNERCVSFLICHGNTKKRIPTELTVTNSELSTNGKKIKSPIKARLVENMRRKLQDRLFDISIDLLGRDVDAAYIAERLSVHRGSLDFFNFADEWLSRSKNKDKKNYVCMLNSLEKYLGKRELLFTYINYKMLSGYEDYLSKTPRAQCMYLGLIRHLYREAMRQYNTDEEQIISNDPFLRYRVPKQRLVKGVRALTLDEFLLIYNYNNKKQFSAPMRARDAFILSFCLMGMNSVDMYQCTTIKKGAICYNRAKTKDRRADGAYIEVKIHPFIKPLMKKYKGRSRVFDFYTKYADAAAFNKYINMGLRKVGEAVGIQRLQFYQARHTFATLSRNLMKFAKSDVDEALNHVGEMSIADVYIAKDFSIINDNNFKLIEKVFGLK